MSEPTDILTDALWVYNNLGVPKHERIDPPSMGAVAWLEDLEADSKLRAAFRTTVVPRLLPSQGDIDKAAAQRTEAKKASAFMTQLIDASLDSLPDDA